ncbi:lysozyme inhibitor LprI family protein [Herbaspirillum sp. NPDC087042]|uniref:lysozyme inhibitor LprI family protein n=1 Tax=Herbaspirillum sp. NPDC087042 TaxID=3364004 RepID=UPI0037F53409
MKTLAYAAALATFGALCVTLPSSSQAASFDCSKAGSANEKAICGDAELSALDDKLGRAFRRARQAATDRRSFRAESDLQWRWREQNCHDRACLLDWYHRRQAELEALAPATLADASRLPQKTSRSTSAPAPALATVTPVQSAPVAVAATITPAAPVATVAPVAPAAQVVAPATPMASAAAPTGPAPLQLGLNTSQIAGVAPLGSMPWPHYVRMDRGEYFYEDPQAPDRQQLVGVRYFGVENGQYIIEAVSGDAVLRYTCSADCAYIGQLKLPGDIEKDMVIVKNDRTSLPSIIVNDAVNGLLAQSGVR